MRHGQYITDPKEVYALELKKLQRCFSEIQQAGEEMSDQNKVEWRQVHYLRHFNFMLQEAIQVAEILTGKKYPVT